MGNFLERKFRGVKAGKEDLPANFHLPRHRHLHAYATVVLGGSFEEAGYAGRTRASEGTLLIHPVLDCHTDHMIASGVRLLRLPWPDTDNVGGVYQLDAIDEIVRAAEKDVIEAASLLRMLVQRGECPSACMNDWPDLLADTIKSSGVVKISEWAEINGLSREAVSRGFSSVYGIPPASFRAEWRARSAWIKLRTQSETLSAIAAGSGFSDQSHMTRWIGRVTGASPSFWRPSRDQKVVRD
jgi:AraC-like DNA-binding protein